MLLAPDATAGAAPPRTARLAAGLAVVTGIAAVANLLNNRWLPRAYLPTCAVSSVAMVAVARSCGLTWQELGFGAGTWRRGLRRAGQAVAIVAGGYAVGATVPLTRTAFTDRRAPDSLGGAVHAALVPVLFGTVPLEEITFRGVLWGLLNRTGGTGWATAGSSLLFGAWHLLPARAIPDSNRAVGTLVGTGPAAVRTTVVSSVAATALGGVVLSELRRRSDSLLAPAGLHWAMNGLGYLYAWLTRHAQLTRGREQCRAGL